MQGAVPHNPEVGQLNGYQVLTKEMLREAAEFRYPVYAVGYNWLQTNGKAADYLAGKIEAIIDRCRKELRVKCDHGVILVTHSMGGLVGRMCAKRYPALIQGVVHGVQPAVGAGTAYRRVRAGWEDFAGSIGLGGTGKLCRYLLMQQAHWSFAQSSLWGRLAAHHLRGQSCRTTTGGTCGAGGSLYANLYGASSVVALG